MIKLAIKIIIILTSSLFISPIASGNNSESIPSVSKLKNIRATDWEYRALQSLARSYDCIHQWQPGNNTRRRENTNFIRYGRCRGLNDVGEVLNPFSSSSSGAISRFGRRDPATLRAPGGAGIGIVRKFGNEISGFAGYFINKEDVADPQAGRGLFGSSNSAIA